MFQSPFVDIFREVFLYSKLNSTHTHNPVIMGGIKVSWHDKRILYMSCGGSNDTNHKLWYKRNCKILKNVIKQQKKYYDELIFESKSKTKTAWKIIKKEIRNNNCQNNIKSLKINNTTTNKPQEICNTLNDYFLSVADTVIGNITKDNNDPRDNMNPSNYSINNFTANFQALCHNLWN